MTKKIYKPLELRDAFNHLRFIVRLEFCLLSKRLKNKNGINAVIDLERFIIMKK